MTDQSTIDTPSAEPVVVQPRAPRQFDQVLSAVSAAMAEVKRIEKGEENKEQGYRFASIDDFLAMVNPICAKAGLIPVMEEDAVELVTKKGRYGDQDWLRFRYSITLFHISGQFLGPFQRHVEVLRSGAQAFGSAQSYALKQFLRAQFLIATGDDDDPDFGGDKAPAARDRQQQEPRKAAPKYDPAADVERLTACTTGRDLLEVVKAIPAFAHALPEIAVARIDALRSIVKGAPSAQALAKMAEHFAPDWAQVRDDAAYRADELKRAEEEARKAEQQAKTNADLGEDEIPY